MSDRSSQARNEIWQLLASRFPARPWDGQALRVAHGPFVVTLDSHAELGGKTSDLVTRLRTAVRNRDGFSLRLARCGFVERLAVLFGAQDVEVGDADFDRTFQVESNRPDAARELLADAELRSALLRSVATLVEIRNDEGWFGPEFPEGVDELYVEAPGRIEALEEIAPLYEVAADLLDGLAALGHIGFDSPPVDI